MNTICICKYNYSVVKNNRMNCNCNIRYSKYIYIKKKGEMFDRYLEKLVDRTPVRICENKSEDTMCALEQPDLLPLPQLRPNFGT